ncbi:MAG: cupin domain-containing protein [Alphaproteobacteria bacterium]|nr:cupin domain-containing protein [Alphaproteobacteria bacterium]
MPRYTGRQCIKIASEAACFIKAEVTRNGETHHLGPHDAISIAAGDQHRLANAGPTVLKVLEVASGTIDPNDIERQP